MLMNFDMNNHLNQHNQNSNGLLIFGSLESLVNDGMDTMNYSFSCQSLEDEVEVKPNMMGGFGLNSEASMDEDDSVDFCSSRGSSLFRQNSSPARFLSNINLPNRTTGYDGMRGTIARLGNVGKNGELGSCSTRLKRQISCFSRIGILPRISEIEPDTVNPRLLDESFDYSFGSWEHQPTSQFIDNFARLNRELILPDGDHRPVLSHHMSLPNTSGEMATVKKLLHFHDSVPCKIRAKRGCATHPRSIAERVRRTRISERMRKLQELVPHMDKQTNTSDILDLAVDYIKELQEQYKVLKNCREKCNCSAK